MWNTYLIIVVALLVFDYLLERITDYLNLKNFSETIPEEFKDVYSEEKYAESQRYSRDRTKFGVISDTLSLPVVLAFILLGGFAWVDGVASGISENIIVRGLAFAGILALLSQLFGLPFSIYSTFVIEERYGFNKTKPKTFVMDMIKGLILGVLLGAPILALVIWFFDSFELAWLYVWGAVIVYQLMLMYIAPVWIMPLFNKFEPLEDGELQEAIQALSLIHI